MTKSRKNEALIRNDGVYVISGIFQEQTLAFAGNAFPPTAVRRRPERAEVASTRAKRGARPRNAAPP